MQLIMVFISRLKKEKLFLILFFMKGLGVLGSFIFYLMLTKYLGAEATGMFSSAYAVMLGVSLVSRFGMGNALVYKIGGDRASSLGFVVFSFVVSGLLASTISLLLLGIELLPGTLHSMIFLSVPFTFIFIFSSCLKGLGKPLVSVFFDQGVVFFYVIIGVIVYYFFTGSLKVYGDVIVAYSISVCCLGGVGLLLLLNTDWRGVSFNLNHLGRFIHMSKDFFLVNLGSLVQSVVLIVVGSFYLDFEEVGYYKIILQLSLIISFSTVVVETIYSKKFARSYHVNDYKQLHVDFKKAQSSVLLISIPAALVVLLYFVEILSFLHVDIDGYEPVVYILIVSLVISNFFSVSMSLLAMSGGVNKLRNIVLFVNSVGLLLLVPLLNVYGLFGLAIVYSFIVLTQSAMSYFYARVYILNGGDNV